MFIQQTFKNQLPTLYLVGTPIGNLNDFSLRAQTTLQHVHRILCEDTRTSLVLLNKYQIKKPLLSLHKFNEAQRSDQVSKLLTQNEDLALISDAGLPLISDPGSALLFQLRWTQNLAFNVSAINAGPAYLHALLISGFTNPTNYFYGFLKSRSMGKKQVELQTLFANLPSTSLIFYEAVHRVQETLNLLMVLLDPNTKITLNRELTKMNEEIIFGTVQEINEYVHSDQFVAKGEFVLVIDFQKQDVVYDDQQLLKLLHQAVNQGLKVNAATKQVSALTHVNKNYLYDLYIKQK